MEDKFTTYDLIKKLNGSISPVGETHVDTKRLENLKNQCSLVEELIMEISEVSQNIDSPLLSMNEAGVYADNFLKRICKEYK